MAKSFELTIQKIIEETKTARTILLDIPEKLNKQFEYRAGQYLTVQCLFEGKPVRRAYSICTSPHEALFGFTVKSVLDDRMSSYLQTQVTAGDQLKIFPPQGQFCPAINPNSRITYYFIGAGSGITPLFSILKNILEQEPLSTVNLLYGNRSQKEIIYKKQIIALAEKYTGQFNLRFVLSSPLPKRFLSNWDGELGRMGVSHLNRFLNAFPKQSKEEMFFLCAPGQMMEGLTKYLSEKGRTDQQIYREQFNNDKLIMESKQQKQEVSKATIHLDGETFDLKIKEQTILQTLIDAGYDPPFSCTSGVCTTCMAKLISGKVDMEVNYGLDEDEVAAGFILTCQSHPKSEEIEVTYDV